MKIAIVGHTNIGDRITSLKRILLAEQHCFDPCFNWHRQIQRLTELVDVFLHHCRGNFGILHFEMSNDLLWRNSIESGDVVVQIVKELRLDQTDNLLFNADEGSLIGYLV